MPDNTSKYLDNVLKIAAIGGIGYYIWSMNNKNQPSKKIDDSSSFSLSDDEDVPPPRRILVRDSRSDSTADFFLCPKELFHEVVPKLMEQVPDPSAPEFAPSRLVAMEYAVRGQVPALAQQIEQDMANGKKFPFEKVIYCNIGNPIAVGHTPYTYVRQLLSAFWSGDHSQLPNDLQEMLTTWIGDYKPGAYTNHRGANGFLKPCTEFLDRRDAHDRPEFLAKAKNTQVYLSDGASGSIVVLMEYLMDTAAEDVAVEFSVSSEADGIHDLHEIQRNIDSLKRMKSKKDGHCAGGIFCPIPQYPLYSATIRRLGGTIIPYELDEDNDWSLPPIQLFEQKYAEAVANGLLPKAFVLINPGNPSGNVLTREDLVSILKFCERHRLVLMADEVYQDNIWGERPFHSMRRVAFEENSSCKVASFHSCSKGLYGECGVRGGFMSLDNFPDHFVKLLDKCFSVKLCPNITGQIAMAAVCSPPQGESKALYLKEREAFYADLSSKAEYVHKKLNELEGVSSRKTAGAMYAFPKIVLPQKAIEAAKSQGIQPDSLYCMDMLNATGIVTVPGSGFKQKQGTYHFRITILPEKQSLINALDLHARFHQEFFDKYR